MRMRFFAIVLLLAFSLSASAHVHCALEACGFGNAHAEEQSPLCEGEQICIADEGQRVSASVVIAVPIQISSANRLPLLNIASKVHSGCEMRREAPQLSRLQTYLI